MLSPQQVWTDPLTGDSKTHLANLPIYYEYKADGIDDTEAIKGTYLDQYKNVFDLYITDSTCDGSELSAKQLMTPEMNL